MKDSHELIQQYAVLVFGDDVLAKEWMEKYHPLLGGSPKDIASTPEGEQEVRRILASIQHGLAV